MDEIIRSELNSILEQYDLGDLVWYERDERGTVNTSFAIETEKDGQQKKYFFRKYKPGVRAQELLFEHSIINYLKSHQFDIVAGVLPTRDGKTFVYRKKDDDENGVYYAIFDFLPGEDRYTWIAPICSTSEIISSAQVLATFHQILYGFTPQGARLEPEIMELLPIIEDRLNQCLNIAKEDVFKDYFRQKATVFKNNLRETLNELRLGLSSNCARLIIHCDFHPGNLKFESGQVAGLFDLDWSKVDYRLFDVALTLYYFFDCWETDRDGVLRLDDMQLFLESYQEKLAISEGLKPLNKEELSLLAPMIAAANLYVLNWTIMDYMHKDVDPAEYLICLKHHDHTIQWLEDPANQTALSQLAEGLLRTPPVR